MALYYGRKVSMVVLKVGVAHKHRSRKMYKLLRLMQS